MTYVKWISAALIVLFLGLFAHYTLPSRDIVKIVGTDVKRTDIGNSWFWASADAGTATIGTRDVRFINTELPNGKPYVYRNEDTAWSWPPYFKFNSGNLTAQAQSLAQKPDVWVAITHYGWRSQLFTIFPNAIRITQVEGPEVQLIPWFNIVFFILLGALLIVIYRAVRAFKERRIDPVLEDLDEALDDVGESAQAVHAQALETKKGLINWFKRFFR